MKRIIPTVLPAPYSSLSWSPSASAQRLTQPYERPSPHFRVVPLCSAAVILSSYFLAVEDIAGLSFGERILHHSARLCVVEAERFFELLGDARILHPVALCLSLPVSHATDIFLSESSFHHYLIPCDEIRRVDMSSPKSSAGPSGTKRASGERNQSQTRSRSPTRSRSRNRQRDRSRNLTETMREPSTTVPPVVVLEETPADTKPKVVMDPKRDLWVSTVDG